MSRLIRARESRILDSKKIVGAIYSIPKILGCLGTHADPPSESCMGSDPFLASAFSDLCKIGLILEGIFNLRNSDFTHLFENRTQMKMPSEIEDT